MKKRRHSGLQMGFFAKSKELSVALPVGDPLCPYGIAYCRVYGLSTSGLYSRNPFVIRCVAHSLRPKRQVCGRIQGYLAHKKQRRPRTLQ